MVIPQFSLKYESSLQKKSRLVNVNTEIIAILTTCEQMIVVDKYIRV